MQPLLRRKSDK